MNKSYTVYQHIFPNGKCYIGLTCQPLDKRFENGRGYKKCPKMKHAIEKYGWENVIHKTIAEGLTKREVARRHGISAACVHKHIHKGTPYEGYTWGYSS